MLSSQERRELIKFLHRALADAQEQGWERFEPMCQRKVNSQEVRASIKHHRRFIAVPWGIALPVIYALLIWIKLNQGESDHHWAFIIIFPPIVYMLMVGGGWFMSRGDLSRLAERPPLSFDPITRASNVEEKKAT